MRRLGHFLYGTWYGSPLLFTVLAFGLPFAVSGLNAVLPVRIPVGKTWAVVLFMAAAFNVLVALGVSVCRRERRRGLVQACLLIPLFFVYLIGGLLLVCAPARMTLCPSDEWVSERILAHVKVEPGRLEFLGGIEAREPIVVFEVKGPGLELAEHGFRPEDSRRHPPRNLFSGLLHPITLPEEVRFLTFMPDSLGYWLDAFVFDGRTFLVYRSV